MPEDPWGDYMPRGASLPSSLLPHLEGTCPPRRVCCSPGALRRQKPGSRILLRRGARLPGSMAWNRMGRGAHPGGPGWGFRQLSLPPAHLRPYHQYAAWIPDINPVDGTRKHGAISPDQPHSGGRGPRANAARRPGGSYRTGGDFRHWAGRVRLDPRLAGDRSGSRRHYRQLPELAPGRTRLDAQRPAHGHHLEGLPNAAGSPAQEAGRLLL